MYAKPLDLRVLRSVMMRTSSTIPAAEKNLNRSRSSARSGRLYANTVRMSRSSSLSSRSRSRCSRTSGGVRSRGGVRALRGARARAGARERARKLVAQDACRLQGLPRKIRATGGQRCSPALAMDASFLASARG